MARMPWSQDELDDLAIFGPENWSEFHRRNPARSYDSWEVKRRRMFGGTAGTKPATVLPARLVSRAQQALRTLTELVNVAQSHAK
jgi:hypothetical protein